jgi:hypothetical protein
MIREDKPPAEIDMHFFERIALKQMGVLSGIPSVRLYFNARFHRNRCRRNYNRFHAICSQFIVEKNHEPWLHKPPSLCSRAVAQ